MANIILTESQFKYVKKKMGIKESIDEAGRTSNLQKLAGMIPDAQRLNGLNMSLFADPSSVDELPEVVQAIKEGEVSLNDFLYSQDIYADREAQEFVLYRVKGTPMAPGNSYQQALADDKREENANDIATRVAYRNSSDDDLSSGDKMMIAAANAKARRYKWMIARQKEIAQYDIQQGIVPEYEYNQVQNICDSIDPDSFVCNGEFVCVVPDKKYIKHDKAGHIDLSDSPNLRYNLSRVRNAIKSRLGVKLGELQYWDTKDENGKKCPLLAFEVFYKNLNNIQALNEDKMNKMVNAVMNRLLGEK